MCFIKKLGNRMDRANGVVVKNVAEIEVSSTEESKYLFWCNNVHLFLTNTNGSLSCHVR